jgi:CelD/BcsL family acetyltransferase involved in cellulose biosynthesis
MYQSMWLGARVVRFVGHLGDQLGLVCAHEDQARATLELRRLMDETSRADLYLIERLPGGREWARLLDGHLVSQVSNPVLQRRGRSWDAVRFSFSRNLRQDIGRRGRRLHRKHRVTYRLVDDVQQLPTALDALERLHQARWGGEGQVSAAQWRFYREFAAVALDRGWLRLWLLQLDETAAAAILGFRYGGDEWFVQAGRNPDFDADGVGFVLLAHAIQTCMIEGVGAFRFLRGDEPYKRRFANGDDGLATVAVPTSPVGALLTGGLLAGRSLPKDLRLWAARKAHV